MMNFLNNPIKYWWQILILTILAVMFAATSPARPLEMKMASSTLLPGTASTNIQKKQNESKRPTPIPQTQVLPSPPPATASTPATPSTEQTKTSLPTPASAKRQEPPPITAAAFFPVFPPEATPDTPPRYAPVASNHPLAEDHAQITHAIIITHDFSRDARRALATLMSLAGNQNDMTMILAPQFLLESDIARYAAQLPNKGSDFVRWSPGTWSQGADSAAMAGQKGISTFTVMDLLLLLLGDREQFPNLTNIVIAGHGEGGDFTQRYAAAGQAPDILATQGVSVRFVAANPSAYLFLTASRPRENKPATTVVAPKPTDEAPQAETPPCPDANRWPYGLDELNAYTKKTGGNAIKLRYPTRKIGVLIGDQVTRQDPAPDTSCAAHAQGADRLARARGYAAHLQSLFSDELAGTQTFRSIPGVGYDAMGIWGSACGMTMLFGDGQCGKKTAPIAQDN
ncbi:MAG: hypothetical protein ABTQ34_02485 [Bdellovibrionales bacterium]